MTLAVVGGIHAYTDGSNRLFEIALCTRGEPVSLLPEPTNKHDPSAVAVLSARGQQIGYLSADRCGWIGAKIRLGEDLRACFQEATRGGAFIRLSFAGRDPKLPELRRKEVHEAYRDPHDVFYPDEIPPDEF